MMIRISGGGHAAIHAPMVVFKNENCSHPIRGVPDSVPGVFYRSTKNGWMNGAT